MTIQEISVRDMQSLLEKILTAKRLSTLGSGERSVGDSVTLVPACGLVSGLLSGWCSRRDRSGSTSKWWARSMP